mgnify:CR=1 FL=1
MIHGTKRENTELTGDSLTCGNKVDNIFMCHLSTCLLTLQVASKTARPGLLSIGVPNSSEINEL